jgi:CPA1 family monovalent cation:H+ antiporter
VANSLLFLLLGLALRPIREVTVTRLGVGVWWPLLVSMLIILVARAVVAWAVGIVLAHACQPWPRGWRGVLTWAGLRGAVSLAVALSLPVSLPQRDLLLTLTFGVVLFTLLVQGLSVRPLLDRLGLVSTEDARHDLELALGRLRTMAAAAREVEALLRAHAIDAHLAQRLAQQDAARREELRAALDATYHRYRGVFRCVRAEQSARPWRCVRGRRHRRRVCARGLGSAPWRRAVRRPSSPT